MSFWVISLFLGALVSAMLALAAIRARGGTVDGDQDMQVYKDQLAEVERDSARGVISKDEAAALRTEVSRRLLDADSTKTRQENSVSLPIGLITGALVAVTVLGGTFFLYGRLGALNYPDMPLTSRLEQADAARRSRPSQAEVEASLGEPAALPDVDPRHLELMDKLRTALKDRPTDLQGHILLAHNEAALGNFAAAYQAQVRAIELKDAKATGADFADLADMLILAAGGYVSPQAEAAIENALQLDRGNGTALYYTGLMYAQTGRPDLAFQVWRSLYENSPADAPWIAPIAQQIETVAADAGVRYRPADRSGAATPGPDAAAIEAARDMTEEERNEMIRGMVGQLSDRLATQGGPPDEWARLIAALGVLGENERARTIWTEAKDVFAGSEPALATLRAAATRAGLTE